MDEDTFTITDKGRKNSSVFKMDRATIYASQQISLILKELQDKKTKSIGVTSRKIEGFRRDLILILKMSDDKVLSTKIDELTSDIRYNTLRGEAIVKLSKLLSFIESYSQLEDNKIDTFGNKNNNQGQELHGISATDFKKVIDIEGENIVFVIMPFSNDFNDVWKGAIEEAVMSEGFKPMRIDQVNKSSNITNDIIDYISNCRITIVDVSSNNPNVMFELGYAVALNKPNIIISQTVELLPFDIRNIRTIVYQNTWSGIEELRIKIQNFLKEYKPQKDEDYKSTHKNN